MRPLSPDEKKELRELILPYLDDLHRVAVSLCHNEANAEDFVAQTVVKACESFRRLRDKSRAKQWLLRILSNTMISHFRREQRHQIVPLPEDDDPFSLFDELSQPFLLWWGNPEREVINKLMDEDIKLAIESIPPKFRLAVVMCDVEGMGYKQIAEVLQVPIGTVRSRVARGRSLLQRKLRHYADDHGIIPRKHQSYENIQKAR